MRFYPRKIISAIFIIPVFYAGIAFAQDFQKFNGEITSDNINIRTDSTVGSDIICALKKHDKVEVTAELYDWYKIRLPKKAFRDSHNITVLSLPIDQSMHTFFSFA